MGKNAPWLKDAATKAGTTESAYLAQQGSGSGAGVQRGLDPVAPLWDSATGDWYYVRAESVTPEAILAGQAGQSVKPQLDAAGIAAVPIQAMTTPTIPTQLGGPSYATQQQTRADQQIIPGTTLERDFADGPRGTITPPDLPAPDAPAAPAAAALPSVKPARAPRAAFKRRNASGQATSGFNAGSRGRLDFGGFDSNPSSLTILPSGTR